MFTVTDGWVNAEFFHGTANKFVEVVTREHQQVLRIEAAGLAHGHSNFMHVGVPFAVDIDTVVHIIR